jgi:hypothetical protein
VGHRDLCKAVLDVGSRNFKFPETVVLRDPIQYGWMYSSSTWGLVIPPLEGLSTTSLLTTTKSCGLYDKDAAFLHRLGHNPVSA